MSTFILHDTFGSGLYGSPPRPELQASAFCTSGFGQFIFFPPDSSSEARPKSCKKKCLWTAIICSPGFRSRQAETWLQCCLLYNNICTTLTPSMCVSTQCTSWFHKLYTLLWASQMTHSRNRCTQTCCNAILCVQSTCNTPESKQIWR